MGRQGSLQLYSDLPGSVGELGLPSSGLSSSLELLWASKSDVLLCLVGAAICFSVFKQGKKVTEQGEMVTDLGKKVTDQGEMVSDLKSRFDNVGYFVLGLVSLTAFGSSVTTILSYLDERTEAAEIKVEKVRLRDRKTQRILTSEARLETAE